MRHKIKTEFLKKDIRKNYSLYIMIIPMVVFFILFHYQPMYGAIIAFKRFSPKLGIWGSEWVGFKYFIEFFQSYYFVRIIKNTILLSFNLIIFGFPAPIIFALLLNEVKGTKFKRSIQTLSYLPHFVSLVVICGIIVDFTSSDGLINVILTSLGFEAKNLLADPKLFRSIYVTSDIWKGIGWGSIIYLAALSSIDPQLYEAAELDGAGRFKKMLHVTIPGIIPTITILFILRIGSIMSIGFEKTILLYNPLTYETADIISSYVYRKGLIEFNFSFSTAVGIFNSIINFSILCMANKLSRKVSETSLW